MTTTASINTPVTPLGANRKLELIAQVFNLLGRDTLGGIAIGWQEDALSDSFGKIQSVQAEAPLPLSDNYLFTP